MIPNAPSMAELEGLARQYLSPSIGKTLKNETKDRGRWDAITNSWKEIAQARNARSKEWSDTGTLYNNKEFCKLITQKIKEINDSLKNSCKDELLITYANDSVHMIAICALLKKSGAKKEANSLESSIRQINEKIESLVNQKITEINRNFNDLAFDMSSLITSGKWVDFNSKSDEIHKKIIAIKSTCQTLEVSGIGKIGKTNRLVQKEAELDTLDQTLNVLEAYVANKKKIEAAKAKAVKAKKSAKQAKKRAKLAEKRAYQATEILGENSKKARAAIEKEKVDKEKAEAAQNAHVLAESAEPKIQAYEKEILTEKLESPQISIVAAPPDATESAEKVEMERAVEIESGVEMGRGVSDVPELPPEVIIKTEAETSQAVQESVQESEREPQEIVRDNDTTKLEASTAKLEASTAKLEASTGKLEVSAEELEVSAEELEVSNEQALKSSAEEPEIEDVATQEIEVTEEGTGTVQSELSGRFEDKTKSLSTGKIMKFVLSGLALSFSAWAYASLGPTRQTQTSTADDVPIPQPEVIFKNTTQENMQCPINLGVQPEQFESTSAENQVQKTISQTAELVTEKPIYTGNFSEASNASGLVFNEFPDFAEEDLHKGEEGNKTAPESIEKQPVKEKNDDELPPLEEMGFCPADAKPVETSNQTGAVQSRNLTSYLWKYFKLPQTYSTALQIAGSTALQAVPNPRGNDIPVVLEEGTRTQEGHSKGTLAELNVPVSEGTEERVEPEASEEDNEEVVEIELSEGTEIAERARNSSDEISSTSPTSASNDVSLNNESPQEIANDQVTNQGNVLGVLGVVGAISLVAFGIFAKIRKNFNRDTDVRSFQMIPQYRWKNQEFVNIIFNKLNDNDVDFLIEILENNNNLIQSIPRQWQLSIEFWAKAAAKNKIFFDFIPQEVFNQYKFWSSLIAKNSKLIDRVPPGSNCRDMWALAVKTNPESLYHFPEEVLNNMDFWLNLIEMQIFFSQEHLYKARFPDSENFWLNVLEKGKILLLPPNIFQSTDFWVKAIVKGKAKIADLPPSICQNPDFWKNADLWRGTHQQNRTMLDQVPEIVKRNEDFNRMVSSRVVSSKVLRIVKKGVLKFKLQRITSGRIEQQRNTQYNAQIPKYVREPLSNLEKNERWIDRKQSPVTVQAQEAITKAVHFGSYDKFKLALEASFFDTLQSIYDSPQREYVIMADQKGKSTNWVIAHLYKLMAIHPPKDIVPKESLGKFLENNPNIKHIVMVDDAAYSGNQAHLYIMSLNLSESVKFHITIPYMTRSGKNHIIDALQYKRFEYQMHDNHIMLNYQELIEAAKIFSLPGRVTINPQKIVIINQLPHREGNSIIAEVNKKLLKIQNETNFEEITAEKIWEIIRYIDNNIKELGQIGIDLMHQLFKTMKLEENLQQKEQLINAYQNTKPHHLLPNLSKKAFYWFAHKAADDMSTEHNEMADIASRVPNEPYKQNLAGRKEEIINLKKRMKNTTLEKTITNDKDLQWLKENGMDFVQTNRGFFLLGNSYVEETNKSHLELTIGQKHIRLGGSDGEYQYQLQIGDAFELRDPITRETIILKLVGNKESGRLQIANSIYGGEEKSGGAGLEVKGGDTPTSSEKEEEKPGETPSAPTQASSTPKTGKKQRKKRSPKKS